MWKDFFFFSGSQRAGIIVLAVLILAATAFSVVLPGLLPQPEVDTNDSAFLAEVEQFKATLISADSLRQHRFRPFPEEYTRYTASYPSPREKVHYDRYPFDPNTLDSAGLSGLGIPSYVVANILRYRRKGGYFSSPEKFGTVYGLKPELFAELEPFIVIDDSRIKELAVEQTKLPPVELNTADSTLLMQVKGIGRGLARSILRFRAASGGFISQEQLREVYGMTDELFDQILPFCSVNPSSVRKISINSASVDKLRAHPYLNFYQARAIYELRRRKGRLSSMDQLKHLEELDEVTMQKIEPYFSFD